MTAVLVAIIAASIVLGVCRLLRTNYDNEKRKRMNRLLHRFSELGSHYNLTFSSQEILLDCIIGLDGVHRKILVAKSTGDVITQTELVDLPEIKSCSVIKHYGTIKGGELTEKKLQTCLEWLALRFERDNNPPVEILFYHHGKYPPGEAGKLEKKARHWETMLSKLIHLPVRKIA